MAFKKLKKEEVVPLQNRLLREQDRKCFICEKEIKITDSTPELAYINPNIKTAALNLYNNFSISHKECFKSKSTTNLDIEKGLSLIKRLEIENNNQVITIEEILKHYKGSSKLFNFSIKENTVFFENEDGLQETHLFIDGLSEEKYIIIDCNIDYIYRDEHINPRGLNKGIKNLMEEFHKGNPQLHVSLARYDEGKLKILDGQHKAVSQILLGQRSILLRIFLDPNLERLTITNTRAGSELRQVAFDRGTLTNLHSKQLKSKIKDYKRKHKLKEETFSEKDLISEFKGDGTNVKKFILDDIVQRVLDHPNNKLRPFIVVGAEKERPISNAVFIKFVNIMISSEILESPFNENVREDQIERIIKLLNIFYDYFYKEYVYTSQKDIFKMNDIQLKVLRTSSEPFLNILIKNYILKIIRRTLEDENIVFNENILFMSSFSEDLWNKIDNFIFNLSKKEFLLNKEDSIFPKERGQDPQYKLLLETGKLVSGYEVEGAKLNWIEMMKEKKYEEYV